LKNFFRASCFLDFASQQSLSKQVLQSLALSGDALKWLLSSAAKTKGYGAFACRGPFFFKKG
jgi:hypothetical protein